MFPRLSVRATFVADTKNVSDFVQKHFASATNVSQFAQLKKHHGQQCVRNNVSSFTRALRNKEQEIRANGLGGIAGHKGNAPDAPLDGHISITIILFGPGVHTFTLIYIYVWGSCKGGTHHYKTESKQGEIKSKKRNQY